MKNLKNNFLGLRIFFLIMIASFTLHELAYAQTLPSGFSQVKLTDLIKPMGIASAPDGRIFICEKSGDLKIFKNGALLSTPAMHLNVDATGERGLLSLTFDPDFINNQYIYIYYTSPSPVSHNRLSRFTMTGDVASLNTENILLNLSPLTQSLHMGGGISFGTDGKIYLSSGENGQLADTLKSLSNFFGKLIRINKDGSAPSDNPFITNPNGAAKYIYAMGFRNPYTLSAQLSSGKVFVNDIGSSSSNGGSEEINNIAAGKNYGWPVVEGISTDPTYANPFYSYKILNDNSTADTTRGCAITGGTFFNPASTNYPATYFGKYFFIDFCNLWINYLDPTAANPYNGIRSFAKGIVLNPTSIMVGSNGNLFYINSTNGTNGLYTIVYSNGSGPSIVTQPVNQSTPQGQSATFSVSAIGSPTLLYQWKKDGSAISGATSASYTIASVAAADAGQYSVDVRNSIGAVTSSNASLTVTAQNALPVGTITAPASGAVYSFNDVINFSGTGTDQEDGTLPPSAFKWTIEFHHDQHFHPVAQFTGVTSGSFQANILEPDYHVAYRVTLTVTDSRGQSTSTFTEVAPILTSFTVNANPAGLKLTVDGTLVTVPYTVSSVLGLPRTIAAPPQILNGVDYEFSSWSNGGAMQQTVVPPSGNTTYTASYTVGTNLALNKPATTSSTESSSYTPDKAVDGNGSTRWSSQAADPQWLTVDLGQTYTVRHVNIVWEAAYGKDYKIQMSSDNSNWADIKQVTANTQLTNDLINLNGTGRYIRIYGTSRGTTYGYSIFELAAYGVSNGNQTPTATITAPANNASFTAPANITITANASDADGTVSKVEFYNGSVKLGEALSSPYSFVWSGVAVGNYSLTVKAIDNLGAIGTSAIVNVVVNGLVSNLALNKPATVSSVESSNFSGSAAVDGNTSTRWASAFSDPQWIYINLGAVYNINRVKITWEGAYGKDYQIQVSNDPTVWSSTIKTVTGNTTLTNDWTGLSGSGQYLRIYGTARGTAWGYSIYELEVYGSTSSNQMPVASITSPANNTTFMAPANITINANASDPDGTVSKVEFYNGTTKLGEALSAPYSFTWSGVVTGTYNLTVRAIDNLGSVGTSASATVVVNSVNNQVPVTSITSPSNNASYTAPASITINANASDADGTVSKVEFYNGATKLGEALAAPYSFVWSGVAAGTYNLSTKAIDNVGGTGTSTIVTVAVNAAVSNIALNKPVTVSSIENSGTPGSAAVDGNLNSRWSSAFSDPQWIYINLGAVYNINRVKITWEGAYGKDYQIQVSNDPTTWTSTIKTVTGNSTLTNDWTGLTGSGQYLRIYGTARGTAWGYSIYELEVYGTAPVAPALLPSAMAAVTQQSASIAYPNPASDYITVNLSAEFDQSINVSLSDWNPLNVTSFAFHVAKGNQLVTIPVSGLETGVYVLTITNAKGEKSIQRISIQR